MTHSFLKKKINIEELLGMLIVYGYKFFNNEFDSLIAVVDSDKILLNNDKDKLRLISEALVIANLIVGKDIYLRDKISHNDFSEKLGKIYIKYLKDVKELKKNNINIRVKYVRELIDIWGINDEKRIQGTPFDPDKRSLLEINNVDDMEKFSLCYAFSDMFSNEKAKSIIAFNFAKYFVKNDMMGEFLKEFEIIYLPN